MIGIPMDQVAIYGAEKGRSKTGHFNWTGGEQLVQLQLPERTARLNGGFGPRI